MTTDQPSQPHRGGLFIAPRPQKKSLPLPNARESCPSGPGEGDLHYATMPPLLNFPSFFKEQIQGWSLSKLTPLLGGERRLNEPSGVGMRVRQFRRNRCMMSLYVDTNHSLRFIPDLFLPDLPAPTHAPAWPLYAVEIENTTFAGSKHFRCRSAD